MKVQSVRSFPVGVNLSSRIVLFFYLPDLDAITDQLEREATVGIIHNCKKFILNILGCCSDIPFDLYEPLILVGQTPRKLFTTSHPQRYNHGLDSLPIGTLHGIEEDAHLLVQESRSFKGVISVLIDSSVHPDPIDSKTWDRPSPFMSWFWI